MSEINRSELVKYLNKYLNIYEFQDYCPNGLQIEGKEKIKKIAFAVSATKYSIEKSIEMKADALIVHHGLFWKFHGTRTITKAFGNRVRPLIKNDINLLGYHLPLDAHLEIGNAISLANKIGVSNVKPFGDHKGSPTGIQGTIGIKLKASELKNKLETILNHSVLHSSPDDDQIIQSIGIITGGANSDWILAQKNNLDAFLTGEMSEHDWHEAKESEVHMFAGGHNATEKFGPLSLMDHISHRFKIDCEFIDSENPA